MGKVRLGEKVIRYLVAALAFAALNLQETLYSEFRGFSLKYLLVLNFRQVDLPLPRSV